MTKKLETREDVDEEWKNLKESIVTTAETALIEEQEKKKEVVRQGL
jgi:hypothetical protein